MTLTINEIIKSVFHAMEKEGISLSKSEYTLIEKEATKIIESLLKLNNKNKIYTENPSNCKGIKVYDERIIIYDNKEFRSWNPFKSKLSAAIHNGLENLNTR